MAVSTGLVLKSSNGTVISTGTGTLGWGLAASTISLDWELAASTGLVLQSSTCRVLAADTDYILTDGILKFQKYSNFQYNYIIN